MSVDGKTVDVKTIQWHRNGITGAGFHTVRFQWDGRNMIATVFAFKGCCAVLDLNDLSECWRGDHFENILREAIKETKT